MAKSTAAEKEQRVNQIYAQLLNGKTRFEILQYGAKAWKLEKRQIDAYIAEANRLIAQEAEYLRPREIGKAKARLERVYAKALADNDFVAAINALRELNKLFSLYEPEAPKTIKLMGINETILQAFAVEAKRLGLNVNQFLQDMVGELENAEPNEISVEHRD